MTAILVSLASCATAQSGTAPIQREHPLELRLEFAEDRGRIGPSAWIWLRDQIGPDLDWWPRGRDPWAPFEIVIDLGRENTLRLTERIPTTFESQSERHDRERVYMRARLAPTGGAPILTATAYATGRETWAIADVDPTAWPHRFRSLTAALALDRTGLVCFDVGVAAAQLAGNSIETRSHRLADLLLTRGAVACGSTCFVSELTADGIRVVRGLGNGGLTLPAMITALAELRGAGETLFDERRVEEVERYRLLAFAARDPMRFEATAQLGRLGESAAVEVLEHLLWSEGTLRTGAIDGLIRSGASNALPDLVHAATTAGAEPYAEALADAAIANLWPSATDETRHATLEALASPAMPESHGARERLEPTQRAFDPTTTDRDAVARRVHAITVASLAASIIVLAFAYVRLRQPRRTALTSPRS